MGKRVPSPPPADGRGLTGSRNGRYSSVHSPLARHERSASKNYWSERIPWYPDGVFGPYRPPAVGYSRRELLVDVVLHVIALVAAIVAVGVLMATLPPLPSALTVSLAVYSAALVTMWGCSLAFHANASSPNIFWYQLADHVGILLLISGTYTPFCALACCPKALAFVWGVSGFSFVCKALRTPLDIVQVHVPCFLLSGWTLAFIWPQISASLTPWAIKGMLCAGVVYTVGLVPWAMNSIEGHNVIWHLCVAFASAVFFTVIYSEVADPSEWRSEATQCLLG
ncbi:hemolysin-III related-domain-containing protein [Pelagophyceae sp. CCMP2097]|nr:hemolysin-III related-domain-containing protein [Pelagophyceae sp. CCMP2097]